MTWLVGFARSTVGAKVVMAVTGVLLFGFTIVHMAGNLQVFWGQRYMDEYSHLLHSMPELLWPIRILLLLSVVAHILVSVQLRMRSAKARPVAYQKHASQASTMYSRTMMLSGPVVLLFIVLHLLNLTFGTVHPAFQMQAGNVAPAAYHNLVSLLQMPLWGVFYLVANVLLGLHLWHGAFSLCRTLGLSGDRQLDAARLVAHAITGTVVGGNVLIASSILLGLVK